MKEKGVLVSGLEPKGWKPGNHFLYKSGNTVRLSDHRFVSPITCRSSESNRGKEEIVPKKDSDRQLISFIIFLILFLLPVNPSFKGRFQCPFPHPRQHRYFLIIRRG